MPTKSTPAKKAPAKKAAPKAAARAVTWRRASPHVWVGRADDKTYRVRWGKTSDGVLAWVTDVQISDDTRCTAEEAQAVAAEHAQK